MKKLLEPGRLRGLQLLRHCRSAVISLRATAQPCATAREGTEQSWEPRRSSEGDHDALECSRYLDSVLFPPLERASVAVATLSRQEPSAKLSADWWCSLRGSQHVQTGRGVPPGARGRACFVTSTHPQLPSAGRHGENHGGRHTDTHTAGYKARVSSSQSLSVKPTQATAQATKATPCSVPEDRR